MNGDYLLMFDRIQCLI